MADIQTNLFQLLGHSGAAITAQAETRLFLDVGKRDQIRPLSATGGATTESTEAA